MMIGFVFSNSDTLKITSAIENIYNRINKNQKTLPKLLISGGYGKIISKKIIYQK